MFIDLVAEPYGKIAAVSTVPRPLRILPAFALRPSLVTPSADARFAKVVETSPNNIADYVRIVGNGFIIAVSVAGIRFGLSHYTFRVALVVGFMLENHIVVTHNVECFGVRVVDFPIAVPSAKSLGNGTGVVFFENCLFEHTCGIYAADVLALDNLVADDPSHNAGVVAVAEYHTLYIVGGERIKKD